NHPFSPLPPPFPPTKTLHEGVTAYGYVRQSVSGPLDTVLLGRALARLAARHPMLRMRITGDGGARPRQYAAPVGPVDTAPRWYEVRETHDLRRLEQDLCNRPFDLTTEDPVRAVLVHERDDAHLAHLLLVVHHAAADGFSLKLLAEELWSLYTALARGDDDPLQLPLPQPEFADYAAAVTAERRSPAFAEDQRYWRASLADRIVPSPSPSLPY
ncbi:condensation domain-containing protein, partial [Streptomyces europaeiscabiei]|uniref:condensation domain-containing protein n=1 Tax=Streptomyces europaeiscabiei TaxID=146819 RepID=UPI0029A667A7